jgi:serine protease AprX
VCGLVSQIPRAVYIMLPVEPGDFIDNDLSPPAVPSRPATQRPLTTTGRSFSGTSAASHQIAGICALLKHTQPGQAPDLVEAVLKASARDVVDGKNAMGDPADDGCRRRHRAGLVDAESAYRISRSIRPRDLFTAPPPR